MTSKQRKTLIGITIVVIILIVIGVMWLLKNNGSSQTVDDQVNSTPATITTSQSPDPAGDEVEPTTLNDSSAPITKTATNSTKLEIENAFVIKDVMKAGQPLIIDFGADSCIPCKEMAPVLADLHTSLEGKAVIHFVDVWKHGDFANGFPIQVIPTQILFDAKGQPFVPPKNSTIQFKMYQDKNTKQHVFTSHEGGLTKPQILEILAQMGMK